MSQADALPYDPGPALTRREVELELVALGFSSEDAPRMVAEYIDETSARVGVRVDNWSLDFADVDAIAETYGASGESAHERAASTVTGQGDVDAAIACAAAAASAAEAAARASSHNDAGDAGGPGDAVVTDINHVDAACDEDGGL